MNFKEIVSERFLRKQNKIIEIYKKNNESFEKYRLNMFSGIIIFTVIFAILAANFIPILFYFGLLFVFSFLFIFIFLFFEPKNINKISNKLNKKEYQILLNKSQYIIFNNKLKKCHYNEFLDNQKLIFKYIETLPLHQQQNSLNVINEKINLNENLIKNTKRIVEEQIKQKDNTNLKSKVLLKNI
tara:strand:- start:8186 stop:8740 length:555 start_codon:yes stop_codon:yes gene_type:complete